MTDDEYWDAPTPQSCVKMAIVEKYFDAWSNVILAKTRRDLCYADLYAGRGKYNDGTLSVPLRILDHAVRDPRLRQRLRTVFNDGDRETAEILERNITSLPGVSDLRHEPRVMCLSVGADDEELLQAIPSVPTVTFLDPFGYTGISLDLISTLTSGFGCECIVFFNTNRIRAAVSNLSVQERMKYLFGAADWPAVRARIETFHGTARELAVIEEFVAALQRRGIRYGLPFRVRNEAGTRASHHLIHVSRHDKAYTIMKEIMAAESSGAGEGVPRFEYNPADERYEILFEYARPLTELRDLLTHRFAGQTLTMEEVFDQHHVGTRFIKRNYKSVLRQMEEDGLIRANPPTDKRPKRHGKPTFADHVSVTFIAPQEQADGPLTD
ncbi:MAG: three-Cys-motif partner protein TcmP [Armatimonadota bacterium]|nr:three-Cys-motif partner protein TcmP [Armatimonadota bacterium]